MIPHEDPLTTSTEATDLPAHQSTTTVTDSSLNEIDPECAGNHKRSLRTTVARWVSILAHPFVMMAIMIGAATAPGAARGEMARNIGIVASFVIIPMAVVMVRQVRRGGWENVDASNLWERPLMYAVGIGSVLALLAYLFVVHPGSFLLRGSTVSFVLLAVCAVTTRWVKVSLHARLRPLPPPP